MVPSYGPLETIQLLSETFLFAGLSFQVIWLPKLKWVTLYIYGVFGNSIDKFSEIVGGHKSHFLQMNLGSETCHYILLKVGKISALKKSREGLQEYAIKSGGFHLKNSRWSCRDLSDAIQGQTHDVSK